MEMQDAISVFQDGGGGGGGGTITTDYAAPPSDGGIVVQMLPAGLNTAPPDLLPPEPIVPTGPVYPLPGNGVLPPPPGNIDTVPNIVTLTSTGPLPSPANPPADLPTDATAPAPAPPLPAPVKTPWLWIAVALGGAYFLFRDNPKRAGVSGKGKKSLLVPALVVGGLGAFYLYQKSKTAAAAPAPTSTPAPVVPATDTAAPGPSSATVVLPAADTNTQIIDPMRAALMNRYAGQTKQLIAIQTADPDTIRIWSILVNVWNTGQDPYALNTNGQPKQLFSLSLGKWWENFSSQHNF